MSAEEIIRLAFLKYKLSSKRSMNTFIFTQAKNNKLTDEEIETILDTLDNKIQTFEEEKKRKREQEEYLEIEKMVDVSFKKKVV